jgi:hypothetical protein
LVQILSNEQMNMSPAAGETAPTLRATALKGAYHGAKTGLRCVFYAFLPLLLLLLIELTPTTFGLGARRGFGVHPIAIQGAYGYMAGLLVSIVFGAIIGLIGSIIRWAGGWSESGTWWAIANRPIRLFYETPGRENSGRGEFCRTPLFSATSV